VHALQQLAKLAALGGPESEVLDGVQSILNPLEADERTNQPLPELPATHRCCRAIEDSEKRSGPAALDTFDHVEVTECHGIDEQPSARS
jgi:hypothetical protein